MVSAVIYILYGHLETADIQMFTSYRITYAFSALYNKV